MKILVIGAGATYAEAKGLGVAENLLPPLMRNFSTQSRIWQNFNPHPFLDRYLEELGYTVENEDGRELFYELEKSQIVNIEKFFEFCWKHREKSWSWSNNPKVYGDKDNIAGRLPRDFISGVVVRSAGNSSTPPEEPNDFWNNMMHHGFGLPFFLMMAECFFENGKGIKNLLLSKKVAAILKPGDLVLNLNYDTIFDLGVLQAGKNFVYSPQLTPSKIMICKPHGSLNMVISSNGFSFGSPEWWGSPAPANPEWRSYIGLIPPRFDKSYEQNRASKMMIESVQQLQPDEIVFWGIGFTESDIDLNELFKKWCGNKPIISVANPIIEVAKKIESNLSCMVNHYSKIEKWLEEHCPIS